MSNIERRGLPATEHPITESEEGRKFTGLAAVFGSPSEDLGGFVEYIDRRAFDDVLATNPDVVANWNHHDDDLLGRTSSGTLRLWTTEAGLHYELDPPDTTLGRDLRELLRRKDVTGSSFAFTVAKDKWEKRDGKKVRTVEKIGSLLDVALVSTPAYSDASVALRSLSKLEAAEAQAAEAEEAKDPERLSAALRRAVYTSKAAVARATAEITRNGG